MLFKHLTIRGFELFEITTDDRRRAAAVEFVRDGLATGELAPVIDKVFPLEAIADAHRYRRPAVRSARSSSRSLGRRAGRKEVASVDVLSGGRMHFGVGLGWINQEMRNHGTNPDDRWRVMRERVEAMRQIWTRDIASYYGDFVDFDRITSWPKPVQRPHPPILVAGNGPNVAKRVISYGDEWIPMLRPGVLDHIAEFKKTARKPGSDEPIPVTLFGGDLADVDAYAAAGVDRVLFWVRPQDTAQMTRTVDEIARHLGDRLR